MDVYEQMSIKNIVTPKKSFIYIKCKTDKKRNIEKLQKYGFDILTTQIVMRFNVDKIYNYSNKNIYKNLILTKKQFNEAIKLSKNFIFSKYHSDSIDKNKAIKIHEEWIKNCLKGNRGDVNFFFKKGNKIVGFASGLKKGNRTLAVDLLVVNNKYSGKGIGTALLNSIKNYATLNKYKYITSAPEISNIPVVNMFLKGKFKPIDSYYNMRKKQ